MKNLKTYRVSPLNTKDIYETNGGETGWYYLAREARRCYLVNIALLKFAVRKLDDAVNGPC